MGICVSKETLYEHIDKALEKETPLLLVLDGGDLQFISVRSEDLDNFYNSIDEDKPSWDDEESDW